MLKKIIICLLMLCGNLYADRAIRVPDVLSKALIDTTIVVPEPGELLLFVHKVDSLILDVAVDSATIITGRPYYKVSFWTTRPDSAGTFIDTIYIQWGKSMWSAYDSIRVRMKLPTDWGTSKYKFVDGKLVK